MAWIALRLHAVAALSTYEQLDRACRLPAPPEPAEAPNAAGPSSDAAGGADADQTRTPPAAGGAKSKGSSVPPSSLARLLSSPIISPRRRTAPMDGRTGARPAPDPATASTITERVLRIARS